MTTIYRDNLKKTFENAEIGQLIVHTPEGEEIIFKGSKPGCHCDFLIKDWKTVELILKRGDIGLGEAYHEGYWDTSNLTDFLTYCSNNIYNLKNAGNANYFNKIIFYFYNQFVRINTKYGSRKNIFTHYDIGNDFYRLWLDPSMTYSSAMRCAPNDSLEQAQLNKYNRIIDVLSLEDKNVLEIGCGWGGFADQAHKIGANVTGITISDSQYRFAKDRLNDKAEILIKDYRDIDSKYDRIVSIEMFEAVGEKYWQTYFEKIKGSLVKGGKALIQTITIADEAFDQYRKSSDYIRHHVFPGGMLPSNSVFCAYVKKAEMDVASMFEFGQDYAWTLRQWQKNFMASNEYLVNMNFSSTFLRAWDFYLSMCIAGFESKRTNVAQFELVCD